MPLDPALVGHETTPETATIQAEDIHRFADAIGDTNPIFHDPAAAERAGYTNVPATPTFITRFRVPFAEAGLDPERSQVLHGEQEYAYSRPLVAGQTLVARHRVKSIRQTARAGGMAIMTLEQFCDTPEGERVASGSATVVVRDTPAPGEEQSAGGAARPSKASAEKPGESLPSLTKHVTQAQIDAYAEVSGDHNPIHLNPEAARAVGLDGTIAHGMLGMAFAGQLLTDWLSTSPHGGWVARLRVRFQGLVRPSDTLTVHGTALEETGGRRRVDVWIENQSGERVITGDAEVALG